MVEDGAFGHKIDYIMEILNLYRHPNCITFFFLFLAFWFKSYDDFVEWVDFAYQWSLLGGESVINGATPPSLWTRCSRGCSTITSIHSLIKWSFSSNIFQKHNPKPEELESWNFESMFIVHFVSYVMCHMSPVTCHLSSVTCIFLKLSFNKLDKGVELVGEGSVINGPTPSSLLCSYMQLYTGTKSVRFYPDIFTLMHFNGLFIIVFQKVDCF